MWSIGNKILPANRKNSFTLIELLVVVVIIGFFLTLSLPRFKQTFVNLQFDDFCLNLVSRIRYLQERALVEQKTYRLNFDLSNKVAEVRVKEEPSSDFTDSKGILAKDIVIPRGIDVNTEEPSIIFYPDGSIAGKDIKISNSQNKATIYIKESIGRAELKNDG
ncbi:MAG: prepilin-type N-terminal cleavage/methylation domain-containing protein [Candidatus Omnitrophica bacterium]|nr:prepilin-type N-terminal cleavage/methylation domain-containing protein [Candidatus Omnitrophota bacterium]MDD5351786.1 prepilin-type N-terminal cleavage/methylation domain-containing protein [Candidatus Omnitrophota bacterium]MDD5550612.1 prepilin-type N-terminal cleavage/methylation domain-containing protein [Candidatus Omnitrophota bacterium]